MKKLTLVLSVFLIVCSQNAWSQKSSKHLQPNYHMPNNNYSFTNGLIAGFFLNEFFDLSVNRRNMYFRYNYTKNKWRLKKDSHNHHGNHFVNKTVLARFENPSGGRDFFVKRTRRGHWQIDAPNRFKKTLKNMVVRNLN